MQIIKRKHLVHTSQCVCFTIHHSTINSHKNIISWCGGMSVYLIVVFVFFVQLFFLSFKFNSRKIQIKRQKSKMLRILKLVWHCRYLYLLFLYFKATPTKERRKNGQLWHECVFGLLICQLKTKQKWLIDLWYTSNIKSVT